ncbi:ABC transporter substrate-binding protein [Aeromicrobium piscarium]|uniref:ABC transporter substrate-binding protein n=1 Tax=Aeromicrobium piscarium TaxID=2590901 RepID=A0A554RI12_9ACTN|nr:ABC transporter substrate-binding protein [Aeromicrobium piscarium]TSD53691.1 ABC transporter substrate-binding protein [Aeromicrobium piscarium]
MSGEPRRRWTAVALGVVVFLMLSACGSGSEPQTDAEGRETVKIRTDVYYSGAVLPLVAGVETGIFEKHDLNVELNEGKESATTIQTVGNGSDDIGYVDAGSLVQSAAQGIDVRMVAGMVQDSSLALYALEESGIASPEDLEGKTAGYTPGSAAERIFPAYAEAAGIDEASVQFRNVDIPTRTELFMAGQTDFTFGLLNVSGPNIGLKCDCDPIVMPYSDEGIHMLSSGIVAGSDFLEDRPETMERFLAALTEAVEWTNANTEEAVEAFYAYAPDSTVDRGVLAEQWGISMELAYTESTDGQPFGCMSKEDWTSTTELMETYGGVDEGRVAVEDIADNGFLPESCTDELGADS